MSNCAPAPFGQNRANNTNGDQAISRAEFDAAVQARFAKLDSDGNGALSAEEREAHKAERRAERQAKRGERRGQ